MPTRSLGMPPVLKSFSPYGTKKTWGNPVPPNELGGYYQIDPTDRIYHPPGGGGF